MDPPFSRLAPRLTHSINPGIPAEALSRTPAETAETLFDGVL